MDRRIEITIALMRKDLHRELSLTKLAQSVSLSVSHLHHLFKIETGMTPAHYLHSLRIERAKELFETTSLNVEQVMIRIGIRDRSHFEREFKKDCGSTPSQCRTSAHLHHSNKDVAASEQPLKAGSAIEKQNPP